MKNKILISFHYEPKVEIKGDIDKEYFVEFINGYTNKVIHSTTIRNNMWAKCNKKWHIPWTIKINGNIHHTWDLEKQNVRITLDSKSVGDTLAWAPQAVEFAKKYKCKVTLSTFHNQWFKNLPIYKDINFIEPGENIECYASYKLGWYITNDKWDEGEYHPTSPNTIPLIQAATDILDLPYKEINHGVNFKPGKRPIKEKYICIGPRSTAGLKEWPYYYWEHLAKMLNDIGYKVVNISYEGFGHANIINKEKLNWQDTYNHLHHAEYFIGLGSGLSWFNWAMNKPTLMVNNFIPYGYEFTKGLTKVEDYSVCNNCWVDKRVQFNKGKWDWCPRHQGTNSEHICHKNIKPEKVYEVLLKLLKFE
tara:strand:+ start:2007 stop:3095 length:1089 start_codon:yes stop_codon:yes gene_type:complete